MNTDNYFFKIKFVFFLYLLLSVSWNENDLPLYISDIRDILGYRTSVCIQPFPWCLHITITYNLMHLRPWNADTANTGSRLPRVSDVKTRKRRNVVVIDMIRNNRIGLVVSDMKIFKISANENTLWTLAAKNTNLVEDLPMNISGKFGSILFSGFREEELNVKS